MSKQKKTEHRMGKQTGYEIIDGEYCVAPMYQERFAELADKVFGIDVMLRAVTKHASDDFEQIAKARKRLWDELIEDIGLDPDKKWIYTYGGVVKEETKSQ